MQTFQTSGPPTQGPKNYVFVDEHNRHKRLKVMRACEGCRRRKIKCDAATTNSWPCAACKRLKLTCVPPAGGIDGDMTTLDTPEPVFVSQQSPTPVQQYPPDQFPYMSNYGSQPDLHQSFTSYEVHDSYALQSQPDFHYTSLTHDQDPLSGAPPGDYAQQRYSSFDSVNGHITSHALGSPQSSTSVTAEELAENLGDLRIAENGIAPYIRQENGSLQEASAPIIDDDEDLPVFPLAPGSQVRIPPALLPSTEDALCAFEDFFRHVHPYVPVLCRQQFLQQWQQDPNSISPLLLETVLACAGQVSDDPAGGSQWLALANRHEQNFVDMPRLSTIQALLLLLKAREKTPKRGYFYRSWILVRKIVGMAKDLDLHEHYDTHRSGGLCESSPADCLSKTRIWQTAMVVELMVGGPQGRSDYSVDLDTVDISPCPPHSDIDDFEKATSRQFAYWVRNVRNIRGMTETYHKLKRKNKDWANDPKFVAYNEDFRKWPGDVPDDLKLYVPTDGTLPTVHSHFIANMHCHYRLGIVLLYKPQLTASKDFANDEKWKRIMSLCYDAAKQVCMYQEAVLQKFDVLGLASMQRGLSFPIYAILSCVMIHLIAITSPDPSYNQDAREYFIRHMRVLEQCIAEWPMPEVEAQIHGLRAAFSADLNKPFDLRPSFPYGTPSDSSRSPAERRPSEARQQSQGLQDAHLYQHPGPHSSYFPSPPISAGPATKPHTPQFYHDYPPDQNAQSYSQMPSTSNPSTLTPTEQWNPTPIINQFNTAFAIPQSALAPPPASSYGSSPPLSIAQPPFHAQMPHQQYVTTPTSVGGFSGHPYTPSPRAQSIPARTYVQHPSQATPQPQMTPGHYPQHQSVASFFDASMTQAQPAPIRQHTSMAGNGGFSSASGASEATVPSVNTPVYVTPKEWQQSVASVFDPSGMKRKWGYDHQSGTQQRHYGSVG